MKPFLIGIAGGSASGKSTIAMQISNSFQNDYDLIVIKQDDYYKDQSHLSMSERVKNNYDHPNAFDTDLLVSQLQQLKEGQTIEKPLYDFSQHTRSQDTEIIQPHHVMILEGIFVLAQEEVRNECDLLIYIDTDSDIRFMRRLKRDIEERGRSLDSIYQQYLMSVRPMHNQFIEPSQKYAHVIMRGEGDNQAAIDLVITKIKSILECK